MVTKLFRKIESTGQITGVSILHQDKNADLTLSIPG
jgi:hypothetical protein